MKIWTQCWMLAVSAALLAGPAVADQPEDAYITSKVKIELLTADGVNPLDINVDTLDGVVTLSGQVESDAARREAEQIARTTNGVVRVISRIRVG